MSTAKKDIPFANIERNFTLGALGLGSYSPPVFKTRRGYSVRVLTKATTSGRSVTRTYDYFELDAVGVVTKAPRGWTPVYKDHKITGLDEAVERYADPAHLFEPSAVTSTGEDA